MPTTHEVFVPLAELPPARPREAVHTVPPALHKPPAPAGTTADTDATEPDADSPSQREVFRSALTTLAVERAAAQAGVRKLGGARLLRRSLDARKGFPLGYRVQVELYSEREAIDPERLRGTWPAAALTACRIEGRERAVLRGGGLGRLPPPGRAPAGRHVVVVGSGPAGTFAAMRLAQAGVTVTLVEQGYAVRPRRKGLAALTRGSLIPESNYCFGEGGAGTFSDGKLYTRSKDRAAIGETLATLIEHGADPDIGVDSRPHIGSNRLPQILTALREDLGRRGVEYRFGEQVTDLLLSPGGELRGVRCASGAEYAGDAVVLAVGHSARGMYEILRHRGVLLQPKPFAVGARIEHPQPLIDRIQYGRAFEHPALPPSFYHVASQQHGRGVYSFCMCPGGWVVPSSTEPDGLCVNGMSLKRRDSPLANSALVVSVEPQDFVALGAELGVRIDGADPLAGVELQRAIERCAFAAGGGGYVAPAQKLSDFLAGRPSDEALRSTYRPRVVPGALTQVLPRPVVAALQDGMRAFDRTMPGFLSKEAQLVGVETRTSAPVRTVRDERLQSPTLPRLFPTGEGAGYAGGIVSAAIDGLRVADAVLLSLGA